ncbi:MAG: hypothetical protein PHU66_06925 [Bacteroidaceae bacterium]|nr:hypothetical protein [Bacteroidaceae bacterium]
MYGLSREVLAVSNYRNNESQEVSRGRSSRLPGNQGEGPNSYVK